ncbi:SusC/RagA family TonB-linked outer membrane protein [Mucilaginibacter terrae]|uniref:TonB-linked SusC/RagA family outer membrane protein n=1 Tax=Mucilaginibacter terrae TaxID=1955052 RepID=A0ABU3GRN3_9SPHI|nr:TonB-dependent receptor [Mucilaginibacter terrae]MDT3402221.1 TonB-linked SusC/RagA family outer membrane protein [Mucilaginibacter terrae]
MKNIIKWLIALCCLCSTAAMAQNKTVSGSVADTTGAPIAGATITEKGRTDNSVQSNALGRFTLTFKGTDKILIISMVGFTSREVNMGNRQSISINLKESSQGLSEVVVVGFGKQRKLTSTGAISSVSGEDLRQNPAASIQNTMAGKLPGFFSQQVSGRPGADGANFYIRGVSSFNTGNNSPTIYVDDIEYTLEQFSRLDPNEIESVTVLKDASATAVFGVRGANGVIIVTTRRGKIGAPQITFRGETSIQQPTIFPKFLNAYDAAVLYNQGRKNDNQTPFFTDADLAAYRDHTDPYGHPDVNWKDELFKKFSRQLRGNFDITGGTQNVRYFLSAGYLNQDGMVKDFGSKQGINNNYFNERYNYRSNLDIKITKTTDLRLDLSGNISTINTPQVGSPNGWNDVFADYGSIWTLAPWAYPIYNPDGSLGYSAWQRSPGTGGTVYDANNIVGRLTYLGYNRTFENNMNLVSNITQKLNFITPGLSLKGVLSYASNYNNPNVSMSGGEFPSFIYNPTANTYEPRNANTFRVRRLIRGSNNGSTIRVLTTQASLNYDRSFGYHHVSGMALFMQQSDTRANSASTYNFIPSKFRSYVGRFTYDFKQRYLFEVNGSYNGSDRFSESKRFGFFPAVSAGWNISEEEFFKKNFGVVSLFKLRGSYGLTGNDKLGGNFSYYYQQIYTSSGNQVFFGNPNPNTSNGIYEGTLGNLEVGWENEKKFDLGLEMGFFKNKLTATIDYFNNNRYDILTDRSGRADPRFGSVSLTFGQTLPPVNLGKVNNKGIEVELNYNGKVGKDLSYSVKGTYSIAKNKIVFADEPTYANEYQAYTGKAINTQRVYTWIGFYQDANDIANSAKPGQAVRPGDLKYADLNGDGVINGFDTKVQGDPNIPNTTGGINLSVRYKNFNIGAFFQGAMNFNVRGVAEAIQPFGSNFMAIHQQAWTPELGNNAKFPLLSFIPGISDSRANPSTFWMIPGDYIRLKTAEVGYTLPQSFVAKLHMKSIKVYSNGYNLLTWTKLSSLYQLDPEIGQGSTGSSGTDRANYPPQRIFNFGVSATF